MNFSFSGRHMEVGESLKSRAIEACEALTVKYGVEFIDVNAVMKKDGYLFYCDISVKAKSGNSYYASNDADDPYISFDLTLQKIDQQMQRKKKSNHGGNREHPMEMDSFEDFKDASPTIVAEILDDLPLLSVSDAARHLNEKTKVFVFENIASNAVNVVYVRPDSNIGWIDYKFKK